MDLIYRLSFTILILTILLLLALALFKPKKEREKRPAQQNRQSIYFGESETGWGETRPSFTSDGEAAAANAIKVGNTYICNYGRGYDTGTGKCDRFLHTKNYLPISNTNIGDDEIVKMGSVKNNISPFFDKSQSSCSALCDQDVKCLGIQVDHLNKTCQLIEEINAKPGSLEMNKGDQGVVYVRKWRVNDIKVNYIIFDSYEYELVKWWTIEPRPGRTLLYLSSTPTFVKLNKKPRRVYNKTGRTIYYYNNVIEDFNNKPSDVVTDFVNIPNTWPVIYAYA